MQDEFPMLALLTGCWWHSPRQGVQDGCQDWGKISLVERVELEITEKHPGGQYHGQWR